MMTAKNHKRQTLKVVVYGLESTGKTGLTKRLAEVFKEPWAAEYVREFWERNDGQITGADLEAIARGQMKNEDDALARAERVVFCDTDLLTCTLWDDLLFPEECPAWVRVEADRRAAETDLYLLCHPDIPYVVDYLRGDGTCFPDPADRKRLMKLWRRTLEERGLHYVEIKGDWAARERRAVEAVREELGKRITLLRRE